MAAFEERWGGLVLPPASRYEGGPKYFATDVPEGSASEGWSFEAGVQRSAVPYGFRIGPSGEFGISTDLWVPLHADVEGWVEALALTRHASRWARQITTVTGDDVDDVVLDGFEPGARSEGPGRHLVAGGRLPGGGLHRRGPGPLLRAGPQRCDYSGLDALGLRGGVRTRSAEGGPLPMPVPVGRSCRQGPHTGVCGP
ncbi:hypothetical protein SCALM49S_03552 [Streptomyces californicus]